ncbi:ribulose-bisphosphate carboxylase large subunit family protein [Mesorhizobium sp. B292B1B]|uniref:ribulose-bisphosphate carboxylase large subunit family protein n=1 Tax=unclassified Mesorhizobium TaxID=325217 RepID=UPI001127C32C|nr:ribulose-bisphosphate carboxylase large subunit family protein [Mesorhizobium sp. B2-3-2]MCA0012314.1 ribulose-bisphosphate carboxylase large subunit family protein [Mesorhizobium sp. B294B1A1]MCA0039104.1 ribulose-bisphosphate carboxylase large subunit family protein [Mesorhizobium sp. B292B1B]TPM45933.1 ribulose 1,5-bisphosphate carboxylase [Mesorhizobium sp. B2-3-2]
MNIIPAGKPALSGRLRATYLIETRYPLEVAAAAMAGEQSSGTFRAIPGETPELLRRFGARVEFISDVAEVDSEALPFSRSPKDATVRPRRAKVGLSWNIENTGTVLASVWSTVLGNLFELHHFSAMRLLDLTFPDAFADAYPGPAFAVEGTRRLTSVEGRPLIGTIVKPSVGLSPQETAALADTLIAAGLDFIKDDELMGDPPHSPFEHRFEAVMAVIDRHADRTGRKVMYAANISGDIDAMRRQLDLIERRGGTCAMLVLNSVGLSAVIEMRRHSAVALHGHRAGWGLFSRSPDLGMSYLAYQKFWRLAGIDHMHVNGLSNKFCEPDESVMASAHGCLTPMFERAGRPDTVMPVFSSGQSAVQAAETYTRLGSDDFIYCCGGGIMAHPGGPAAGVRSLHDAFEAAAAGIPARDYAATHPELEAALQAFG